MRNMTYFPVFFLINKYFTNTKEQVMTKNKKLIVNLRVTLGVIQKPGTAMMATAMVAVLRKKNAL